MKTLQNTLLICTFIALLSACQSDIDAKQVLSKADTRKEIMNTIANDSSMHMEMMTVMMNGENGKKMMGNHTAMMKMMKDNPGMMHSMMSGIMEECKSDTAIMSSMCKTMMENDQMMNMMQKMKGMDKAKATEHKLHH